MKEGTTYVKGLKGIYIHGRERDMIIDCLCKILRNANEQTKGKDGVYIEKFYLENKEHKDKLKIIKQIVKRIDF